MNRLHNYLHDLRTLPGDTALAYRIEGLTGAWKAVAARSLHRIIRAGKLIVFAQHLDRDLEPVPLPGLRITRATEGDWPALGSLRGQRELGRLRILLSNCRHHCLIAWRRDQPVGYAWVAEQAGPDVSLWPLPFEFPAAAAYLWNLYVRPAERGNGIGSALAQARLELARQRGFREAWRMVAPSNHASLRTLRRSAAGARVLGELRFVELFGRTYARFSPAAAPIQ
jgi:ribosomal protein S18 acetylase RimI-like enzyme